LKTRQHFYDLPIPQFRLLKGDCLETLKGLDDNSIDSVVCDPPYELNFMGKAWDNSGIAFSTQVWSECYRVLKPGGHLIAFGGTRTIHRITCAIEDSGFDIRDQICWMQFQGFPKSLDISKQIDKTNGQSDVALTFTRWMRTTGLTTKEINQIIGTKSVGGHYREITAQPAIPTKEHWEKLKPHINIDIPQEVIDILHAHHTEGAKREAIGLYKKGWNKFGHQLPIGEAKKITKPATPEAQKWEGWGTALKPSYEPAILARKPISEPNIAQNVLKWGTGGLNVDGCRFAYGDDCWVGPQEKIKERDPCENSHAGNKNKGGAFSKNTSKMIINYHSEIGRWPANIYQCPKPPRSQKEAGLDHLESIAGHEAVGREPDTAAINSPRTGAGRTASEIKNIHPTVKPIKLMRWLVRLVTPPGGTVLDPFLGSGTTAAASILEGFDVVGCELTDKYWPIIEGRTTHALEQWKQENSQVSLF